MSAAEANSVAGVIKQARDAGLAVVTFDADGPNSARQAYVGTDNKEMGRQTLKVQPRPGPYVMQ